MLRLQDDRRRMGMRLLQKLAQILGCTLLALLQYPFT
jgi:hypothetical protein